MARRARDRHARATTPFDVIHELAKTTWLEGEHCYDLLVAGDASGLPILSKPPLKPARE